MRDRVLDALEPHELQVLAHALRDVLEVRRLRAGSITVRMPARCAATVFSLMPPTGSTSPRRLISPVIATSLRTVLLVSSDTSAV